MRILYIAEIVGKIGVWAVKQGLPVLKKKYSPDLVVANGDGATGGRGLGRAHGAYLLKLGINVITGGDYIYSKRDMVASFSEFKRILPPCNLPEESPGSGFYVFSGERYPVSVVVVSLLGRSGNFRIYGDNPFHYFEKILPDLKKKGKIIFVDFHGGTSAEKETFFYAFDGKVSCIAGSHGRIQTSDNRVLKGGTGVICDSGRTGALDSVGGFDVENRIRSYKTMIPEWPCESLANPHVQGACFTVDDKTGGCVSVERFSMPAGDSKDFSGFPEK